MCELQTAAGAELSMAFYRHSRLKAFWRKRNHISLGKFSYSSHKHRGNPLKIFWYWKLRSILSQVNDRIISFRNFRLHWKLFPSSWKSDNLKVAFKVWFHFPARFRRKGRRELISVELPRRMKRVNRVNWMSMRWIKSEHNGELPTERGIEWAFAVIASDLLMSQFHFVLFFATEAGSSITKSYCLQIESLKGSTEFSFCDPLLVPSQLMVQLFRCFLLWIDFHHLVSVRWSESVYDYRSPWFVSFDTYAGILSASDECKWHCSSPQRNKLYATLAFSRIKC